MKKRWLLWKEKQRNLYQPFITFAQPVENTYDTTPPSRCGISMTGSEKFLKIVDLNS